MNTFDFILPASRNAVSAERENTLAPPAAKKSAEPFDSLMHRALARPVPSPEENNSPVRKPAREIRPRPADKAEPASPRKVKDAAPQFVFVRNDPAGPANAGSNLSATAPEAKGDVASKPDAAPAAPPAAANPVSPADDSTAAAMQLLAAGAGADVLAPAPVLANSFSTTGSQSPGNDAAAGSAVGTGSSTSASGAVEKNGEARAKAAAEKGKEIPGAASDPAKKTEATDGAVPITALLDKAEKVDETPANIANSATAKPHASPLETTGTSAAQQAATMNKAEHEAKVAGTPEPSLAGVTVMSALQSAAHAKPAARAAARVESSEAPTPANFSSAERTPSTAETSSTNLISASSQTELRTRALDRTHDILALQGLRLKETNAGSLSVVIKPGAGVQLALQLKQTADGIEAQAILQQGDFKQLNQHWADLQQRLVERGIKLAPLGQDGSSMNSGSENFQRPSQQSAEQYSLSAGAFAEFASAGAATARPVPAVAVTARGWEGWA